MGPRVQDPSCGRSIEVFIGPPGTQWAVRRPASRDFDPDSGHLASDGPRSEVGPFTLVHDRGPTRGEVDIELQRDIAVDPPDAERVLVVGLDARFAIEG